MSAQGWYYLHENGELIYKPHPDAVMDIRDSDLARALWPVDPSDRLGAWTILVEALAAGANLPRIKELAAKWGCDDEDAQKYASRIGCQLSMDGDQWYATRTDFISLQESPAGFGVTALEAMADLCRSLGYRPAKMWGTSFADLLTAREGS
ncbi:MAG: hypothetical protein WCY32_14545 [Burkholderiaceae bacterium]